MTPTEDEEFYGKTVIIDGPIVCVDGTRFEDYTWQEHLYYNGFAVDMEDEKWNTSK